MVAMPFELVGGAGQTYPSPLHTTVLNLVALL